VSEKSTEETLAKSKRDNLSTFTNKLLDRRQVLNRQLRSLLREKKKLREQNQELEKVLGPLVRGE